jgi:hypothetical protein
MAEKEQNSFSKKADLADIVKKESQKLLISGEEYLVYNIKSRRSLLDDYLTVYADTKKRNKELAKRVFKTGNLENNHLQNNYSLVFDKDMKLVYAFNTAFFDYDPKSGIVLKSAEEVLLDYINRQSGGLVPDKPEPIPNLPDGPQAKYGFPGPNILYGMPRPRRPRGPRPGDVWLYGMTEPTIMYGMPGGSPNITLYAVIGPWDGDFGPGHIQYKYGFPEPNDDLTGPDDEIQAKYGCPEPRK